MSIWKKVAPWALGKALLGKKHKNPADDAQPHLNQIPAIGKEAYEPYKKEGMEASQIANPIQKARTEDPIAFINNLMRGYKPSEGYQYREKMLRQEQRNNASLGGYAGTSADSLQRDELLNGLLSQDMDNFLSRVIGLQDSGLGHQSQRQQRGYEASGNLGNYLGSNLTQQAGLAFQGRAQQNANSMAKRKMIMQLLASLGGSFASGGQGSSGSGGLGGFG